MDVYLTVVLGGLLFSLLWVFAQRRGGRLPPGPLALPVLGNLPFINKNAPHESILGFSKTHGPVMTLYLGWQRVVILVGSEAVKEAIVDQGDDFSGRAPLPFFYKITKGYGLAISNGERWKQLRRFTLTTLRDYGMGRKPMEAWIKEESRHLVKHIESLQGVAFDPTFVFSQTVSNIICCLVFGERFPYGDKVLHQLLETINDIIRFNSTVLGQLYNIFPRLLECLPGHHRTMFLKVEKLVHFTKTKIEEHRQTLDPCAPRDFIDCFLLRMHQEKENPDSEFHSDNLWTTTINLFAAGTETTSSTLRFSLSILSKYPDTQERMQEEIDAVIGRERSPNMEDRKSLPFTDAVIHEVQRLLDIVPMGVPRYALKNIPFRGYIIPKGTVVFPVLSSVLKEDQHWATPLTFNPQHFLDQNGHFKKNPSFIPFAAGKRACVGESLARMELFLFLVTLLQHFSFSSRDGPDSIDLTPETSGFSNVPRRYQVLATPR